MLTSSDPGFMWLAAHVSKQGQCINTSTQVVMLVTAMLWLMAHMRRLHPSPMSMCHLQVLALHAAAFFTGYQLARRAQSDSIPLARCISLVTGMQVQNLKLFASVHPRLSLTFLCMNMVAGMACANELMNCQAGHIASQGCAHAVKPAGAAFGGQILP